VWVWVTIGKSKCVGSRIVYRDPTQGCKWVVTLTGLIIASIIAA